MENCRKFGKSNIFDFSALIVLFRIRRRAKMFAGRTAGTGGNGVAPASAGSWAGNENASGLYIGGKSLFFNGFSGVAEQADGMNKPLHILHLEDEPDFAELVRSLFAQDQLEVEMVCVGDRASFERELSAQVFDVIISDYHLPKFTGLEALALAKKQCLQTPFILVSGTIGEQTAIESLKAGASDYVLKQHPERLASAVRRAVTEAVEREKLRLAELELARREKYFRALTENSLDILCSIGRDWNLLYNSPSVEHVLGYKPEELVGENAFARVHAEDLSRAQEALQFALDHPEQTFKVQLRYKNKAGEWRRLEVVGRSRLDDPEINGIVVSCRDVTDRWRAEEELRDSERQYRLLFHSNPNPVWVFDLETRAFLEVNEATIQNYGYSREEFLTMTLSDIRPPDKDCLNDATIPEAASEALIFRHRRKDGSHIEAEVMWTPMVFHDRFAALALAVDVTERRRVEQRNAIFSKLSHRLSAATTAAEAARIICETADALFRWTDFVLDLYDAGRDEVNSLLNITTVEGRRVEVPPSPQPKTVNALVRRVIKKGAELMTGAGTGEYSAATMLAPVRKGEHVIGLILVQNHRLGSYSERDLEMLQTLADQCAGALERVRAEQALRETQQRFRDLFENSPDAIFVEDLDGTVLDVNFAACVLHGLTREQLIGKSAVDDLVPPARRETARSDFQKLVSGKLSWVEGESLTSDGRFTPVEVRAGRIEYGGKPAMLLHVRDITDRQEASSALHSSEMLFRSVWENSVDGMRLADENGVIIAVNDAYCKLVGLDPQSLEGKPFTVVYAESEDRETMLKLMREHFATRDAHQKWEEQFMLHDGRGVSLEISESFIEVRGRPLLMLSLFRDVTSQKRLEEQLRQSQKMEAIGQLAGGVAHDFNNILTVIHGHASLLAAAGLDEGGARSAQQIAQAAKRAAGLTRQLLTFSRRQLIQPKRLDMNKIVGNMTDMLGRILGEDVELQLNYSMAPATVQADAGMMEQVLLNLSVNARDAMPRGGQLSIRISLVDVSKSHLQRHPEARAGRFVCVSNSDTGTGIPPENLSRIFEPFFTTKEVGKGTGLGLATVYGIVKQHQGWVEVESVVGKGTTFRIYIPYAGEKQVEAEKNAAQVPIRGGTETILLVEDEKPVRELVARVLERHGYKVLPAGTGAEAVEIWRANRDEINLLFTDLIMPGAMNGRELAEALWKEQPNLNVIFTSGYSADIVGKDFKIESDLNFLQKPYHPQTLALTVRRCLDKKS
jgi:PAS domain S-box-containing protein